MAQPRIIQAVSGDNCEDDWLVEDGETFISRHVSGSHPLLLMKYLLSVGREFSPFSVPSRPHLHSA